MSAVREGGAGTAACRIVAVGQCAPGEVGFRDKLPGFIIFQTVVLTFRVGDFGQAGQLVVAALQPFTIRADNCR